MREAFPIVTRSLKAMGEVCLDDGNRVFSGARRSDAPPGSINEAIWQTQLVKSRRSGEIWLETAGRLANVG